MTEEKTNPPAYTLPEVGQRDQRSGERKWVFGLLFYAGAVTAGLITVSVLGSVYLNNLQTYQQQYPQSQPGGGESAADTKNYEIDSKGDKGKEDVQVDRTNNREVIHYKGEEYGENGSWMVLDFEKNMGAVYDGKEDLCYIFGGLDPKTPDARAFDDMMTQGADDEGSDDQKTNYEVNTKKRVKDLSVLPKELYSLCWGKDVFWAEPKAAGDDDAVGRQKRGCGYKYGCYYVWGSGLYCYARFTCSW